MPYYFVHVNMIHIYGKEKIKSGGINYILYSMCTEKKRK